MVLRLVFLFLLIPPSAFGQDQTYTSENRKTKLILNSNQTFEYRQVIDETRSLNGLGSYKLNSKKLVLKFSKENLFSSDFKPSELSTLKCQNDCIQVSFITLEDAVPSKVKMRLDMLTENGKRRTKYTEDKGYVIFSKEDLATVKSIEFNTLGYYTGKLVLTDASLNQHYMLYLKSKEEEQMSGKTRIVFRIEKGDNNETSFVNPAMKLTNIN